MKKLSKLALRRSAIRILDDQQLAAPAGGCTTVIDPACTFPTTFPPTRPPTTRPLPTLPPFCA